jgi:hypothetical protein
LDCPGLPLPAASAPLPPADFANEITRPMISAGGNRFNPTRRIALYILNSKTICHDDDVTIGFSMVTIFAAIFNGICHSSVRSENQLISNTNDISPSWLLLKKINYMYKFSMYHNYFQCVAMQQYISQMKIIG